MIKNEDMLDIIFTLSKHQFLQNLYQSKVSLLYENLYLSVLLSVLYNYSKQIFNI